MTRVLHKLLQRKFYILDMHGEILHESHIYMFRYNILRFPEKIIQIFEKHAAVCGWFTEEELRKQRVFLARALRPNKDSELEMRMMTGIKIEDSPRYYNYNSWQNRRKFGD